MDLQTKFTFFLLKLINAKKLADRSVLKPKRSKKFVYPHRLKKYRSDEFLAQNRHVITFSENIKKEAGKHIVFLHGGAYTAEEKPGHWWLIEQLVKSLGCKISFIQYPLAPEHNYRQTHEMLLLAYTELTQKSPKDTFYLLGDSAGGGLVLAFAQTLRDQKFTKQPQKLALLSPWLDLSMSNPEVENLESRDLLLSAKTLATCGKWFAGETDVKSPVLSPLYGNMNDLISIAVFVGTHEIFLPDCRLLKQKIQSSNTKLYYREYEGMQHDWILFPIKERDELLNELITYFS